MINRNLRKVHNTHAVSTPPLQANKENVKPKHVVASSSAVLSSTSTATIQNLAQSCSTGGDGNAHQTVKPVSKWLINWIDRNSTAQANENTQQPQVKSSNLLSTDQNQPNSSELSVTAPEEVAVTENDVSSLASASGVSNKNTNPVVERNAYAQADENVQQSQCDSFDLSLVEQNQSNSTELSFTAPEAVAVPEANTPENLDNENDVSSIASASGVSNNNTNPAVGRNANEKVATAILHVSKQPKKRSRTKSMYASRDVRLGLDPPTTETLDQSRRAKRTVVPVHRYNYGIVSCTICHKKFRQDIPLDCYAGDIVCSFECFKSA